MLNRFPKRLRSTKRKQCVDQALKIARLLKKREFGGDGREPPLPQGEHIEGRMIVVHA